MIDLTSYTVAEAEELAQRLATKTNTLRQVLSQFMAQYPHVTNDIINSELTQVILHGGAELDAVEAHLQALRSKPTTAGADAGGADGAQS